MATVKKREIPEGADPITWLPWQVRWSEWQVTVGPDGTERRARKQRSSQFATKAKADKFRREVEDDLDEYGKHQDERTVAVATIRTLAVAWVKAARGAGSPDATVQWRHAAMNRFLSVVGSDTPATELSPDLLRRFAEALPGEGRQAATRHRYVLAAEQMWAWAEEEEWPGVPRPRRITGRRSADSIRPPAPPIVEANPTWPDCDAMIAALRKDWHRRVALVQRYQGLRIGQVISLQADDVNLEEGWIRLRADAVGAKGARRTMWVPLHAKLAEQIEAWGITGGPLFTDPWRADAAHEPFSTAWKRAGIDARKWARVEGRGKGRPTHAIRATLQDQLRRKGVAEVVVDLLVCHTTDATKAAYIPSKPDASPHWPEMKRAIALIPPVGGPYDHS